MSPGLTPEALARLVEARRDFLTFIQKRVNSKEAAEDILQAAFVRSIEKGGAVRDEESVVAWFYRTLRTPSSITIGIAHHRRSWPRGWFTTWKHTKNRTMSSRARFASAWRVCSARSSLSISKRWRPSISTTGV